MKCEAKRMYPLWGLLLSFSWWNVSCVDSQYNLDKDIDMTVNVGGEYLTLPVGSTDTAFLSKIIEVNEGDILQPDAATHVYHLTKKDEIKVNPTTVKEVKIGESTIPLNSMQIVYAPGSLSGETISADINTSGDFEATANDIDKALKELGSLRTKDPVDLTLTIDFKKEGSLSFDRVEANALKIVFPEFIIFKEGQDGIQEHELILDNQVLSTNGSSYTRTLKVEGYEFSQNAGTGKKPDNGTLTIEGGISMDGSVTTSGVSGEGTLSFTPKAVLGDMNINSVTGVIQPNIDVETTEITFNDLPDFLKDDATRLEITNPVIVLKANNPLNTSVDIDAVLTPKKNNAIVEGHEVKIGAGYGKTAVTLNPGENVIAFSRVETNSVEGVTSNVVVSDINNVIEIIPDNIDVSLKPVVTNDNYYDVELGRDYQLTASCDVDVPLSFEQGLNIVYSDSIKDLNKDLKDVDKVTLKKANIVLSVDNTIPLNLQLKPENVQIKDVYGRELTSIVKTIAEDKQYVMESKDGTTPATSEIVLSLTTADNPGFLSKIDKICFKITAATGSTTGVPLKDTQWLKVTSIKLSVPGGITVDLN